MDLPSPADSRHSESSRPKRPDLVIRKGIPNEYLLLLANLVTTSKAPVTSSVALVTTSLKRYLDGAEHRLGLRDRKKKQAWMQ